MPAENGSAGAGASDRVMTCFSLIAPHRSDLGEVPKDGGPICALSVWANARAEGTLQWETMRVRVGCEFSYESEAAVPMLMLVRPQPTDNRIEYESRWTDPELPIREYLDVFGNTCWRFVAPGGELRIRYDALVAISEEPDLVEPNAPLIRVEELPD